MLPIVDKLFLTSDWYFYHEEDGTAQREFFGLLLANPFVNEQGLIYHLLLVGFGRYTRPCPLTRQKRGATPPPFPPPRHQR
jgi:hypothetical protein